MKRLSVFVATVLTLTLLPLSALSHTDAEQDEWYRVWEEAVFAEGGLSVERVAEYQEFAKAHEPIIIPSLSRVVKSPSYGQGVEQWRGLVAAYFPAENVDGALAVMRCESGGNPHAKNPRSSASGLFQFLRGWWSGSWGYPGGAFDPFNPEENVKAAAWLSKGGSDWSHWVCKP